MSFSENNQKPNTKPTISEEIARAYLIPSYQTETSRNIRAEEERALLFRLVQKDMDITTLNFLLQKQKEDLYLLEKSVKKQEEEIKEQMLMLTKIDKEKLELIERLAQGIKEIEKIREKIDLLLESITKTIEKIDKKIAVIEKRNNDNYKLLHNAVEKSFQKIPEQGSEKLKLDESGSTMDVNLNHLVDDIKTKILKKIERQDTDLTVDNGKRVDKYLAKLYQEHAKSDGDVGLHHFMQRNSHSISSIKEKMDNLVSTIQLSSEAQRLLAEIKNNNEKIKQLEEKKVVLMELGGYLSSMSNEYEKLIENAKKITENRDKLSVANMDKEELTSLASNFSDAKAVDKKLDQANRHIENIDAYLATLTDQPAKAVSSRASSSYGRMMPNLKTDVEGPKAKQEETRNIAPVAPRLDKPQQKVEEKIEIDNSPSFRRR